MITQNFDADDCDALCERCGGEGWIMACDGDGSDWGEDTYCGPMDATIECRSCKGTGYWRYIAAPASTKGEG